MAQKNAKIYGLTSILLAVLILGAIWLGSPVERDDLNVIIIPGNAPESIRLTDVEPSYQYSLDGGLSWTTIGATATMDILVGDATDIIVRDIDVTGIAERYNIEDALSESTD